MPHGYGGHRPGDRHPSSGIGLRMMYTVEPQQFHTSSTVWQDPQSAPNIPAPWFDRASVVTQEPRSIGKPDSIRRC